MITHAMIMGISGVYISWGKSMQSWVYSTLPEEKRTQEPVKQLPRNLLLLPLLGKKKKKHFPMQLHTSLMPHRTLQRIGSSLNFVRVLQTAALKSHSYHHCL